MLSLILVLLSSVSFAETKMMVPMSFSRIPIDVNPVGTPSHSQFKTLERKYSVGRTVEIGELKGWYSGRCFFQDTPSHAVATLLAADSDAYTRTNGPAFSGAEYRHITPLIDTAAGAMKFDHPESMLEIEGALRKSRNLNAFPVRGGDEMIVSGYRTTDLEARAYKLRKSSGFLMLRLECAETSYCSNYSGWVSNKFLAYEGEAVAYCYYFKKVK